MSPAEEVQRINLPFTGGIFAVQIESKKPSRNYETVSCIVFIDKPLFKSYQITKY
jgi:hypothetical protein